MTQEDDGDRECSLHSLFVVLVKICVLVCSLVCFITDCPLFSFSEYDIICSDDFNLSAQAYHYEDAVDYTTKLCILSGAQATAVAVFPKNSLIT